MIFFNRGGSKVGLIGTLDDLKYFLNKNNVNKDEFGRKLWYAIRMALRLTKHTTDKATYDDILNLIAFYVTDGDRSVAVLVSQFIDAYLDVVKGLGEEEYKYFDEVVFYYLKK